MIKIGDKVKSFRSGMAGWIGQVYHIGRRSGLCYVQFPHCWSVFDVNWLKKVGA